MHDYSSDSEIVDTLKDLEASDFSVFPIYPPDPPPINELLLLFNLDLARYYFSVLINSSFFVSNIFVFTLLWKGPPSTANFLFLSTLGESSSSCYFEDTYYLANCCFWCLRSFCINFYLTSFVNFIFFISSLIADFSYSLFYFNKD